MIPPSFRSLLLLPLAFTLSVLPGKAAIVYYSANATTPFGAGLDDSGVWLNFFTGTVVTKNSGDGYLPYTYGAYQLNFNSGAGYLNLVNQTPYLSTATWTNNTFNSVERLGSGQSVDAGDVYTTNPNTIMASTESYVNEWDGLGRGFVGVSFNDVVGGNTYYGYLDVTVGADYRATLNGFAYENVPGTAIVTGAIPEPSVAGLATVGMIFLGRRRRSKAA